MGDYFKQQGPTPPGMTPDVAGPAPGMSPPQPQGFGQGLTNALTNPVLGSLLTGYFGAIGAPRRSGLGGALSRGGLMAMYGLPNLLEAQQKSQLFPYQLGKEKLGYQQAIEQEQAEATLPDTMEGLQQMSPRQIARLPDAMRAPIFEMATAKQQNTPLAAQLEAMAQSPQYAGTQQGQMLHLYAGQVAVAAKPVDATAIITAIQKGDESAAQIALDNARIETEHARVTQEIPATVMEKGAQAHAAEVSAGEEPIRTGILQQQADIAQQRANIEAAKVPGEQQKAANTIVSQYTKTSVMPGIFGDKGARDDNMYWDLRNTAGLSHQDAITKVRILNPTYQGPSASGPPQIRGAAPPSAPPRQAAAPAATPQAPPPLPQGGTHYLVDNTGNVVGWHGDDEVPHYY